MSHIQIAIDGPSGAGKSSLSKAVAKALGIIYVDTGALYRTVGYYAREIGLPADKAEIALAHAFSDLPLVPTRLTVGKKPEGDFVRMTDTL